MESVDSSKCGLCLKAASRYTCPRCNVHYCSSDCYKCEAHLQCSESFYRDCFMDGLKDMNELPGGQEKMMAMLQRIQEETEECSDGDFIDLPQRLEGLDLEQDTDKVWSVLTPAERQEFQNILKNGRIGCMLKKWEPWWFGNLKVEDLSDKQCKQKLPCVLENIQDISVLLKHKPPAESIKYSVVNILYGYAHMCHLHNGDYEDVVTQFSQDLQQISKALNEQVYSSTEAAVYGCTSALQNEVSTLLVSPAFSAEVIHDVIKIIEGKKSEPMVYLMAALSDVYKLVRLARKEIAQEMKISPSTMSDELRKNKQSLFHVEKKVEFLLGWLAMYGEKMKECVVDLKFLYGEMRSELGQQKLAEEVVSMVQELKPQERETQHVKNKPLIEEIN